MKKNLHFFKVRMILFLIFHSFISLTISSAINGSAPDSGSKAIKQIKKPEMALVNESIISRDWRFVENKGQLKEPNGSDANGKPLYYIHNRGTNVYCKPGMISFVFIKMENNGKISEATNPGTASIFRRGSKKERETESEKAGNISTSRMDLVFVGSNKYAQIIASDQLPYYENYYTDYDKSSENSGQNGEAGFGSSGDQPGITNVHTFKTLTYKNIYPNIDMLLSISKGQNIEYSFLIHPGGKVSDIQMRWNGVNKSEMSNSEKGSFHYCSAFGSIAESVPHSYSCGKELKCHFTNTRDIHGFKVEHYNKAMDLLIDPILWATYYGGSAFTQANAVSTDVSGNVYITGFTWSTDGIASSGAYQTVYQGGGNPDAFLAKFSSTGAELWATYYGGDGADYAYGLKADASGNEYIAGTTNSDNLIATTGAYQTSFAAGVSLGYNAFLAKFSSSGTIVWATYYGGEVSDGGNAVNTDGSGNVYLAGSASSDTGIATAGAYQTTNYGGTSGNSYLAKFSSAGALSWGTYFGGSGSNGASSVCTDGSGNVFIAGYTASDSGIATTGAYNTSFIGGSNSEAYLAKFSSTGVKSWATYYGGTSGDGANAVTTDGSGNVYITGYTASDSGIATSGANQTSFGGTDDCFLAKFSSAGVESWATYFGDSGDDEAYGVCTDASGNVNITGYTVSSSGIASSGAYQSSYGGGFDGFLAQFSSDGALSMATYFGGSGDDFTFGITTDGSGNLYIAGNTTSSGLATSGAFNTSGGGGFLAKFSDVSALPVSLLSFGAVLENHIVNLNWQTASEINNNYFGVERSLDGLSWETIGQVPGHGNSQVLESYAFTDNLQGIIPSGAIYYRLKQVDYNGNFQYSMIRSVTLSQAPETFTAYPNPASNTLTINWTNNDNAGTVLNLIDARGSVIYSEKENGTGPMQKQLDLSAYPSGSYIIQLISGEKNIMTRTFLKE